MRQILAAIKGKERTSADDLQQTVALNRQKRKQIQEPSNQNKRAKLDETHNKPEKSHENSRPPKKAGFSDETEQHRAYDSSESSDENTPTTRYSLRNGRLARRKSVKPRAPPLSTFDKQMKSLIALEAKEPTVVPEFTPSGSYLRFQKALASFGFK